MTEPTKFETIQCESDFNLSAAQALYPQLLAALLAGKSIIFDGEAIERVDMAAMQLCCAFMTTQSIYGQQIQWYKPSQPLIDAAILLGLSDQLHLVAVDEQK